LMGHHSYHLSFPDVQLHIVDAPSVGNCRPEATGPESITTIEIMDSGLAPRGAPRNDDLLAMARRKHP
jgi:hypothetical protein